MASPTIDRRLGLVGNTAYKAAVTVVATTNITQSGEQTIDSVALKAINAAGVADRVLCTGMTNSALNGIWDVSTAAWTRSLDADGNYDLAQGSQVYVAQGSAAQQIWALTTANPITVGTTGQTWTQSLNAGVLGSLAASGGSALVGFLQAGTGAVARTVQAKLRERVSVVDFGAVADDSTDCLAAFNAATTACASSGATLTIPPGTYKLSGAWTIGYQAFQVVPLGAVTLHFSGAGQGVVLDGSLAGGSGIFGAVFGGDIPIKIKGNASTTDISFLRAIHHSLINIDAKNGTTGCRINFAVATRLYIECSNNTGGGFTTTPVNGLILDIRGAGELVADCDIFPIIEGVSGTGIVATAAEFSNIRGGTVEQCNKGITFSSSCSNNQVWGTDFEQNTVSDVEDGGQSNHFHGAQFASGAVSLGNYVPTSTCSQGAIFGGYCRWAFVDAAAVGVGFFGVPFSSIGITGGGAGNCETLNCYLTNGSRVITSKIADQVGESGKTWTPAYASAGGGAQGTVTTAVGTYCRVGKLVFVQGLMLIAKGTLGAGAVSVTGLPFGSRTTTNDVQYLNVGEWDSLTLGAGYTHLTARITAGASAATLIKSGVSVGSAVVNVADFADPMFLRFSGCYEAA